MVVVGLVVYENLIKYIIIEATLTSNNSNNVYTAEPIPLYTNKNKIYIEPQYTHS